MSMSITAINGSNDQIINKIEIPRDSIHYRLASNHMTNILYVLSGFLEKSTIWMVIHLRYQR